MADPMPQRPPRVHAGAVTESIGRGRNGAAQILCEGDAGRIVSCVVKMKCTARDYAAEWVATCVMNALGVPTPPAYEVMISRDFAMQIHTGLHGEQRRAAIAALKIEEPASCFGAQFMEPTVAPATDDVDRDEALFLFLTDILLDNSDRRATNPNLLVHQERLLAFDHELCFSFLRTVGTDPGVAGVANDHFFGELARRHSTRAQVVKRFREKVAGLTGSFWDAVADGTPQPWREGCDNFSTLIGRMRERTESPGAWLTEAERWMGELKP